MSTGIPRMGPNQLPNVPPQVSQAMSSVQSSENKFDKYPGLKLKYSLYSALAFFLISSPQVYSLVQAILGSVVKIADPTGCPTSFGLILHTLIFLGLLYLMMSLPRDVL
jgi:hypothetical protein